MGDQNPSRWFTSGISLPSIGRCFGGLRQRGDGGVKVREDINNAVQARNFEHLGNSTGGTDHHQFTPSLEDDAGAGSNHAQSSAVDVGQSRQVENNFPNALVDAFLEGVLKIRHAVSQVELAGKGGGSTVQLRVLLTRWRSNSIVRVGFFAVGVLAVLTVATLFIPRATIKLTPISQQQSITIPVSANPDTESVFISGSVPARQTSVLVTVTQAMTITSQGPVPGDKAEGIARFTNLTPNDLTIPAATVIYTTDSPSVEFQTVNETHLPGGSKKFVEVPIAAVEAGSSGNVVAGAIQAIEGDLALSASVTNPDPTAGGTDLTATEAADADRQHLHDLVMTALDQQAKQEINASIGAHDFLLPNTLKADAPSQEVYDPPAGQPGDTLKLTVSVQYNAQYVTADDLTQLAQTILDASMPEGFVSKPDTLQFNSTNVFTADQSGSIHFNLQAERTVIQQIPSAEVIFLVRGLSPTSAKQTLQSKLPLAAPPEIEVSPSWWPWMPFRITVQ